MDDKFNPVTDIAYLPCIDSTQVEEATVNGVAPRATSKRADRDREHPCWRRMGVWGNQLETEREELLFLRLVSP